MEKCPVCDWKLDGATMPQSAYKGKSYRLCCAECKEKFDKTPSNYVGAVA